MAEEAAVFLQYHGLWDRAATLSCEIGLGGLIHQRLAAGGPNSQTSRLCPPSAMEIWQNYRRHLFARFSIQFERYVELQAAMDGAGLPFLVLKGLALHAMMYDRIDLRPMADIDVLIREADWPAARFLLFDLGWHPESAPLTEDFFPRFHYEQPFITNNHPRVRLDLHVRPFRPLLYRERPAADDLFHHVARRLLLGRPVPTLGAAVMLIHLMVHAAVHGAARPLWLFEMKRFADVECSGVDAHLLCATVESWRLVGAVRLALRGLGTLPGEWPPLLRDLDRQLPRWGHGFESLALRQAPFDAERPLSHLAVGLLSLDRWKDRVDYLGAYLAPGRAHLEGAAAGGTSDTRAWARLLQSIRKEIRSRWQPTMG